MGYLWLLFTLLIPSAAQAMHEADHRFTVSGYVRDEQGKPLEESKVRVVDTRIGLGETAFTDNHGYYEVVLHLHNDNLGDEIRVEALGETKTLTATFDPEDRTTERKVQLDFGALPPEGTGGDSAVLWAYAAGAAVLASVFFYWRRRTKRKAQPQSKGWKKKKK